MMLQDRTGYGYVFVVNEGEYLGNALETMQLPAGVLLTPPLSAIERRFPGLRNYLTKKFHGQVGMGSSGLMRPISFLGCRASQNLDYSNAYGVRKEAKG